MAAASGNINSAAANGDLRLIESLISDGADVNQKSKDGMTPMCVAAFWGYDSIVATLLTNGADVNICNKGTGFTPLHCAVVQENGKCILKIMELSQPDIYAKDSKGRTPVDFASALDGIWPFFGAKGCRRSPKADLVRLNIIQKVTTPDPALTPEDYVHFSRPGSAYVMKPQSLYGDHRRFMDPGREVAAMTGDVLAGADDSHQPQEVQRLAVWQN